MTESDDSNEMKRIARQDAVYFLMIAHTSVLLQQLQKGNNPLGAAQRLYAELSVSLREAFFYEHDSSVAQQAHEAVMTEVRDIIRRALPRHLHEQFASA